MKFHISIPFDGQSNIFLRNGLEEFARENAIPLELTFTDHRNEDPERAVEYINKIKPDVCMFLYLNNVAQFYDDIKCPIKCGWIFDMTFGGNEIPVSSLRHIIDKFDYFFTISPDHAKKLKNGFWAPEGCDPYSHYPLNTNHHFGCTFVGQLSNPKQVMHLKGAVHTDRFEWLDYLGEELKEYLLVFGPLTGDLGQSNINHSGVIIQDNWRNNVVSCRSEINLGHSGWPNLKYSWSARDYRIMAAGGFLITNRIKGHTDFFQDGRNIVLYNSIEECLDKIRFYRNQPSIREKIAQKSKDKVLSSFTFKHSFEKIFQHMELV